MRSSESAVCTTWSSLAFWKTPTSWTLRFIAWAICPASACRQRRGELGTKIIPSAHAPCSAQSCASPSEVMPQNLTLATVRA